MKHTTGRHWEAQEITQVSNRWDTGETRDWQRHTHTGWLQTRHRWTKKKEAGKFTQREETNSNTWHVRAKLQNKTRKHWNRNMTSSWATWSFSSPHLKACSLLVFSRLLFEETLYRRVSTFVRVTQLGMFKETLGQFQAVFVPTKQVF